MATIVQQLEQIIPKSLDDIIRSNREKVRLYLSTETELDALKGAVPIQRFKGEISNWAFITFFLTESGGFPMVYLTGFNKAENSSWMTSLVTAIHGEAVATTSGSLYRLIGERTSTPDLEHICATLNTWGIGPMFDVPPFFF